MKPLSRTLLILYLLILVWLILFKFSLDIASVLDHQVRSLNLTPFADLSGSNLREAILNLVVFIPLGLLSGLNFKRSSIWRKLALVLLFSLGAELVQFILAIGTTDITDVITNTSGGLLGLMLYDTGRKYVYHEKLDRCIGVTGTILLTLFVLGFGILLPHGTRYHAAPDREGARSLREVETSLDADNI